MMRQLPFGTAEAEVLLKLTSPQRTSRTWSRQNGDALYENRALTEELCRRLARHGLVTEAVKDGATVYTVNKAGIRKARDLSGAR